MTYSGQAADKAEHHVGSAEKNEQSTLKALHKAEHSHDRAVSDLHQAQNDLQVRTSFPLALGVDLYACNPLDEEANTR